MEIVEVECTNCSKKLYVQKKSVREKLFCTLKCMDSYTVALKTAEHFTDFPFNSSNKSVYKRM
jgi:hypothetical protein